MLNKLKELLAYLKVKLDAFVLSERPVLHTAWEAFLGFLLPALLAARSSADIKVALGGALTVGFAALKSALKAQAVQG